MEMTNEVMENVATEATSGFNFTGRDAACMGVGAVAAIVILEGVPVVWHFARNKWATHKEKKEARRMAEADELNFKEVSEEVPEEEN